MDSRGQVFCLGESECLRQPEQMELYPEGKIFSGFFSKCLKCTWSFENSEKKDDAHSLFSSEIIDCTKRGYLNA